MAPVEGDHGRASPLSGLWSCVAGGLLIVVLLLFLQPATRLQECPNYGGNGNASAFPNDYWDLLFPLLMLGWVVLVVTEQALPVTWRHRSRLEGSVRAAVAVTAATVASCCLAGSFAAMCR
jgi:hypothetical protein